MFRSFFLKFVKGHQDLKDEAKFQVRGCFLLQYHAFPVVWATTRTEKFKI